MERTLLGLFALAGTVWCQPTVAPTPDPVGRPRGEDAGAYNITNSFELGYRFHSVDGSMEKYRADVNYGNGIRLLSSSLTVHSKEGHGHLFDEIVLNTRGLGNDPYESADLRIQRNKLYRYNFVWRLNDYVNPGLYAPAGRHPQNTRRMWQDHDFTLFPQGAFQLFGGYGRNTQSGPALSSVQLFDSRGNEFPLFQNIDRFQREYRLGGQVRFSGFQFVVMRSWQRYEEETTESVGQPVPGYNPDNRTQLNQFQRTEPYSGDTPFWRGNLYTETRRWFAVNARFTYAGTKRDFTFDEAALGTDRFGSARNRQIRAFGSGRRPLSTGSATLSLFPSDRVTITNHTAFHQVQMDGDSTYQELNNTSGGSAVYRFRFLGIRTLVNSTEATLRAAKAVSFYGGYHFSTRRIRSTEGESFAGVSDAARYEQDNRVHAGRGGVRLKLAPPLTVTLDAEIGRAERPFYPISERDYHALGGRVEYRTKTLTLAAATRANYNFNSVTLFSHSARARNYSGDATWTPTRWFALDAGYAKLHTDTLTGIAYFAGGELVDNQQSLYVSNIHTGNLGVRFSLRQRVDFYAGYSRVQDTGDGQTRSVPPTGVLESADAVFRFWQVFPLTFESPQARVSVRLHNRIRWNFGYQYYRYDEEFLVRQNYRAHTGYTSVLWSF